jgi:hypothetical protein
MKTPSTCIALLLASMLATTTGAVHADLFKCTDQNGHITVTDMPCDGGVVLERTEPAQAAPTAAVDDMPILAVDEPVAAQPAVPPDADALSAPRSAFPPAAAPHQYARLSRPASADTFAIDAKTLRAAREMLALNDQMRHTRLASR